MYNPEYKSVMKISSHLSYRYNMDNEFFLCENINIFGYLGSGGGGGGGFNNHSGSILVHLNPFIYINLHVKYVK